MSMKFDKDKLRYGLIPPIALRAIASVLTFGAEKYRANSWQDLENGKERYTDALYRHLEAWRSGEVFDEESGKPHLWHALTNLAFLVWFERFCTVNVIEESDKAKTGLTAEEIQGIKDGTLLAKRAKYNGSEPYLEPEPAPCSEPFKDEVLRRKKTKR